MAERERGGVGERDRERERQRETERDRETRRELGWGGRTTNKEGRTTNLIDRLGHSRRQRERCLPATSSQSIFKRLSAKRPSLGDMSSSF